MELGKKTKKVLEALNTGLKEKKRVPTLRELAKQTGFTSTWPVRYHLKKLSDAGLIKLSKSVSRGIELLRPVTGIPLVGRISAGKPIDAVENTEEYLENVSDIFGAKEMFALKVKGDSMEGAGILDGDIVFVKKQATADNGDIVAAIIGSEATVKRYHLTKEGVKLTAENPKYAPIISKEAVVVGKIVGVMRRYK